MVRVTYSLDDDTVARIRRTATKLRRPQSQVVREAVAEYAARADRLSERERQHALDVLHQLRVSKPTRSAAAVDAELSAVRRARSAGGRRHPSL